MTKKKVFAISIANGLVKRNVEALVVYILEFLRDNKATIKRVKLRKWD